MAVFLSLPLLPAGPPLATVAATAKTAAARTTNAMSPFLIVPPFVRDEGCRGVYSGWSSLGRHGLITQPTARSGPRRHNSRRDDRRRHSQDARAAAGGDSRACPADRAPRRRG